MRQALPLLRFLRGCAARGEPAALVTLTDVIGGAARAPGEHMVVAASGAAIGSFSGGCVEAAVIAEAQDAIAAGEARLVRFGTGSRYIDIRLPCGGGIDLLFTPSPDALQIDRAITMLEGRRSTVLHLTEAGSLVASEAYPGVDTGWEGNAFCVRHDPNLRVVILGHGAEPMALHDLAAAYGADPLLLAPQASLIDAARARGISAHPLRSLGPSEHMVTDRWTAVVTLFHDHDWETALLLQALEQAPFFIGAMGSRKTHAERCQRLLDASGGRADLARIVGPVGLLPASRDPHTLALSVMAQVVQAYEQAHASTGSEEPTMNNAHCPVEPSTMLNNEPEALPSTYGMAAH